MEIAVGIGLGILSGLLSGLVGIGGGVVIIPFLVLVLGYSQHLAQGTALLAFALPVFGWASWNYYKHGRVDWRLALSVAAGIAIASFLVAQWVQHLRSATLTKIFAVFLILIAAWQFWRTFRSLPAAQEQTMAPAKRMGIGLFVGIVAGALKGLTGLGGGVIIVPLLTFLAKTSQHLAQGTSLLTMTLPIGVTAVIPYWQKGNVNIPVGLALAGGILVGSAITSRMAQRMSSKALARVFSATVFIMGIFLLVR